jgi:hypothetical protein
MVRVKGRESAAWGVNDQLCRKLPGGVERNKTVAAFDLLTHGLSPAGSIPGERSTLLPRVDGVCQERKSLSVQLRVGLTFLKNQYRRCVRMIGKCFDSEECDRWVR